MDTTRVSEGTQQELEGVLRLDSAKVESHLDVKVRQAVEDVLNGMLQAETESLCNACRYERNPDRQDTRTYVFLDCVRGSTCTGVSGR